MRFMISAVLASALLFLSGLVNEAQAQSQPAAPQVPAVADTALVEISLPEGSPTCLSVAVSNDTLGFGMVGGIKFEFDDPSFQLNAADLKPSAPWLKLSETQNSSSSGQVVFDLHVYRLNPFRIKVGTVYSPVIFVAGSTSDLSETAAIRMPRTWGPRWWILVLGALVLALMIMGIWWLWRRRLKLEPLAQWDPAPAAWLNAAIELRQLLENDYPDLDSSRQFLDQLAVITRGYLAGRFGVHAGEMTSGEILVSCQQKGHDSRPLRRMVRILQGLDHHRYNPEAPVVSWCHTQANEFLDTMTDLRILPRYTQVDAGLLVEAEKAWGWLVQPENRPLDSAPTAGGKS